MDDLYKTVHGWSITGSEREWLRSAASDIEVKFTQPIIVNIGVLHGATMHCLRAGAPSAQLFGVDINYESYPIVEEKKLAANMIEGDSGVCHTDFSLGIHLLFIDGDHLYDGVKADIVGWTPKVVIGGVVSFHDYHVNPPTHIAGVKKAIDEWKASEGEHWEPIGGATSIRGFRRIS